MYGIELASAALNRLIRFGTPFVHAAAGQDILETLH